jgi:hypothetical protein
MSATGPKALTTQQVWLLVILNVRVRDAQDVPIHA